MEAVVKTEVIPTQEQTLRTRVREILGVDVIRSYQAFDWSYTFRDTAFIYFLLFGTVALAIWLHAKLGPGALLLTPMLAILTGVAFNWINVQIHEASHHFLLTEKKWNDIYCNIVLGAWALQDVETYRASHGMHHRYLHSDRDPDLWIYTTQVGSLRQVLLGIVHDLTLQTVLRRRRQIEAFMATNDLSGQVPAYAQVGKVLAQACVVAVFVYSCGLWGLAYYAGVYLYGLLGVFPVLVRIRTVVQHHDDAVVDPSESSSAIFVSRTTVAPVLEFLLIGARMDYHFEHHLFPTLPYYGLRRMHQALDKAGFFNPEPAANNGALRTDNYFKSYRQLVAQR